MLDSSTLQSWVSREERFALHRLKYQHVIQYLTTGKPRQDWTRETLEQHTPGMHKVSYFTVYKLTMTSLLISSLNLPNLHVCNTQVGYLISLHRHIGNDPWCCIVFWNQQNITIIIHRDSYRFALFYFLLKLCGKLCRM